MKLLLAIIFAVFAFNGYAQIEDIKNAVRPTFSRAIDIKKISKDLSSTGDTIISNLIDSYTGKPMTIKRYTASTPIVDSIIYFQIGGSYYERVYDKVDVTMFGANQNNADNSVYFNKALAVIERFNGKNLYIPNGVWKITHSIITDKFFSNIEGEGLGTIIRNNGTESTLIISSLTTGVKISNITFQGNGTTYGAGATNSNAIELISSGSIRFDHIFIEKNGGNGIKLDSGCYDIFVNNCRISNNAGDGINSVYDPNGSFFNGNNLSITNSQIAGSGGNGIRWNAVQLNIFGSAIEGNKGAGILLDASYTGASNPRSVAIVGNYIEDNFETQIKFETNVATLASIQAVVISGNYIRGVRSGAGVGNVLIKGSGRASSLRHLLIDNTNRYEPGGAVTYMMDLGQLPTTTSKVFIPLVIEAPSINLGEAELIMGLKATIVSGLFNQKGFPFSTFGISDNFYSTTPKSGIFELPMNEGELPRDINFIVKTNSTDTFTVKVTVQTFNPLTQDTLTNLLTPKFFGSSGGNLSVTLGLGGYTYYRTLASTKLYIKIEITNPVTGSTMYITDLSITYV